MNMYIYLCAAFPQDIYNKEKAGEEDASEQADPPLDSDENRQHDQVYCPLHLPTLFFFLKSFV
jgi:hypothetical protein